MTLRHVTIGRLTFVLASILLALSSAAMADCASDVPLHLDWCSRDHGFNEGASCGLSVLSGVLNGLPAAVAEPILGNIWDRTNMMGATKVAWQAGYKDQAVDAAVCCQVHNNDAHSCLASRRDLVQQWLANH
jgi:hypothetical protein